MSSFIQDVHGNRYRLADRKSFERVQFELPTYDEETDAIIGHHTTEAEVGRPMTAKVLVNVDTGEEVTDTLDLGTHWLTRGENGAYIYTPKDKV